jgi:uncharacterized protein (DUF1015 family)
MPEIAPFRGIIYDTSRVKIESVVAPPYDVISREQQTRLYDRSPHNVVRLILGREEDRYAAAAQMFAEWQREGVLVRDVEPALYVVHQTFEHQKGGSVTRKGFIALCRLEEFDKNVVLPHEKTHAKPREDRLKLLRAARANFSQIFTLYADPEKAVDQVLSGIARTPPVIDVEFEDVQNNMWRVTDSSAIGQVRAFMHDQQVLIADGHHRYETALAYRDECRAKNPNHTGHEPYNFVMMFFTNIDDDGLVIYPTHRLVHSLLSFDASRFLTDLEGFFIVHEVKNLDALQDGLDSTPSCAFGLVIGAAPMFYLLTLKPAASLTSHIAEALPPQVKKLDVTVLHNVIIGGILGITTEAQEEKSNLDYVKDARRAVESVQSGTSQMAFLVNPTRMKQVREVAKAGFTMPQKSTYFYPKLLSGLVINSLE